MKEAIRNFQKAETIAFVGISRDTKKFGNNLFKEAVASGRNLIPVHPELTEYNGVKCYPSIDSIDRPVDAILLNIKPSKAVDIIEAAKRKGIKNIWFQPGSQSEAALNHCKENNISAVSGYCFLLFNNPAGFHKFHRFLFNIFNSNLKEV